MVGWHASARLEDAANVAAVLDHVVIVRSPRPGAALAGVAQDQRPTDGLAYLFFTHRNLASRVATAFRWRNHAAARYFYLQGDISVRSSIHDPDRILCRALG